MQVASVETGAAMEVITKESAEADKVKQVVSTEEAAASAEAAKVRRLSAARHCRVVCLQATFLHGNLTYSHGRTESKTILHFLEGN